jgi:hypothetical protein
MKYSSVGGNAGLFFFGSLLGRRWCVISGRALSDTGRGNSVGVGVTPTVRWPMSFLPASAMAWPAVLVEIVSAREVVAHPAE